MRLKRLIRKLEFRDRFFFDFSDHRNTVFLTGTGRSGTTWVEDIINFNGAYRLMFEPFHSRKVPALAEWRYRQYLRPENRDERFLQPASRILNGTIRHPWIDRYNRTLFARRRLIKDIRAQLILKWIQRNFPDISLILLLRHPCAVAHSKMKLGWSTHLEEFLDQDELMEDFLRPFEKYIRAAADPYEKHIFLWCIENFVPLKQFRHGEMHMTFYEHLCTRPDREAARLLEYVRQPVSPRVFKVIRKPSALARPHSAVVSGSSLIDTWRTYTSVEQVTRAREILGIFGLDAVYGEDSLPLVSGDQVLDLI
ncbi:MAG: sulfotransferase domain-containing protein [Nitrososphaera sp.]|nr:sulfotransferase domain-containing protein [Nitrososphaera sp.]